jgi:hypothetical protein
MNQVAHSRIDHEDTDEEGIVRLWHESHITGQFTANDLSPQQNVPRVQSRVPVPPGLQAWGLRRDGRGSGHAGGWASRRNNNRRL